MRRLAGPALRDIVTGRRPAEIDPEIGELRAWVEYGGATPARAMRSRGDPSVAPSGAGTGYGITTLKDGPLERGELGFDDARARTPTGKGISAGRRPPQTFSISSICAPSLRWLQREGERNAVTLESMELVLSVYEHLAKKTIAVCRTAEAYRGAFKKDPYNREELERILVCGVEQLTTLRRDFKSLETGYARAIATRNGDPTDIPRLLKAKGSLEKLIYSLSLGAAEIKHGSPAPPPEPVGFGL